MPKRNGWRLAAALGAAVVPGAARFFVIAVGAF